MLKKYQLLTKNKTISQRLLTLMLLVCMSGCANYRKEPENNDLIVNSIPRFPIPHEDTVKELKTVCSYRKCNKMYDWLGRLMIFEKQLEVVDNVNAK